MSEGKDQKSDVSRPALDRAAHASPYPLSRLAPAVDLVDVAREIAEADAMVSRRVSAKLQVIVEEMRALQAQARKVLEQAREDQRLHRARCAFHRIPGKIYHLYRRSDGALEFSLLSPVDWGERPPHEFLGSYRLESDMSWTPTERLDATDDSREELGRLLDPGP